MNHRTLLLLLALPSITMAAPLIDQHFEPPCTYCAASFGFALAGPFADAAQTVTSGVTGALDAVDIYAYQNFSEPWVVDIVSAPGGKPNGAILAQSNTFSLPSAYGWVSVPIPAMPFFNAGDRFAIDVRVQGVTGSPLLYAGGWGGGISPGSPYAGGEMFAGSDPASLAPYGGANAFPGDFYFRTEVSAVPEPNSPLFPGLLLAAIAASKLVQTRKRVEAARNEQ